MQNIKKILVPVDFSPCSHAALQHALMIAEKFGARIDVLHTWDLPAHLRPDLTVWAGDVSGSLAEHARREAEKAMEQFLDTAGVSERADVSSAVVGGAPYASILAAIDSGDYDFVTMGTHGRTGISHALLGSVAERVVRHASVPVLTVREPGDE